MVEQRLRDRLAEWNAVHPGELRLAASVGTELLGPSDARSLDDLLQAADEAMYVHKRAARAARAARAS
jgi:GGDEF domain-containing protein